MSSLRTLLLIVLALALPVAAHTVTTRAPLAEVNGEPITAEEVDRALGAALRKLEEQRYEMKRLKVEALIGERLLAWEAARRNISVQTLLDAEVASQVGLVTEQEIETVYRANQARLKGEEAKVREQIRTHLQNQKLTARREALLQSLRSKARVVVHLQAPPVLRVGVTVEGAPFRGPALAPVTIVEFSDFHCPFCKQVLPTLTQLLSRYGEKIKLVYRDFPIDGLHPQARRAAEAARCAHDQGKFWSYHDALLANAPKASPAELTAYAQQVGLDPSRFERCLSSGIHRAAVQRDVEDGTRLGVTGTPAFFINGRLLLGALSLDSFVRVIDEELVPPRAAEPDRQERAR